MQREDFVFQESSLEAIPETIASKYRALKEGDEGMMLFSLEPKKVFRVPHKEGGETYCILHASRNERSTGRATFFLDVEDERVIGWSLMWFYGDNTSLQEQRARPYVAYTRTGFGQRKRGLGERRLRIMNAFSQREHGFPLHSGTELSSRARRIWKRLKKQGEAREVEAEPGERPRYAFVVR